MVWVLWRGTHFTYSCWSVMPLCPLPFDWGLRGIIKEGWQQCGETDLAISEEQSLQLSGHCPYMSIPSKISLPEHHKCDSVISCWHAKAGMQQYHVSAASRASTCSSKILDFPPKQWHWSNSTDGGVWIQYFKLCLFLQNTVLQFLPMISCFGFFPSNFNCPVWVCKHKTSFFSMP